MPHTKERVPAVAGWFTTGDAPALLGTRCASCGTYFFPREESLCRNPDCIGGDLGRGRAQPAGPVWSYTDNRYQPPAPTCPPTRSCRTPSPRSSWQDEHMVVLGQLEPGVDVTASTSGRRSSSCWGRSTRTTTTSTWCGSGAGRAYAAPDGAADEQRRRRPRGGDAPVGQVGPQLRRVRRRRGRGRPGRRRGGLGRHPVRRRAPTPSATATRASSPAPRSPRPSGWNGTRVVELLRRLRQRAPTPSTWRGPRSSPASATWRSSWAPTPRRRASSHLSAASAVTTRTGCASTCSGPPTRRTSPSTPAGGWRSTGPRPPTSPGSRSRTRGTGWPTPTPATARR